MAPWQSLNFLPLPHGQGALRGVLSHSDFTTGCWTTSSSASGGGLDALGLGLGLGRGGHAAGRADDGSSGAV